MYSSTTGGSNFSVIILQQKESAQYDDVFKIVLFELFHIISQNLPSFVKASIPHLLLQLLMHDGIHGYSFVFHLMSHLCLFAVFLQGTLQ